MRRGIEKVKGIHEALSLKQMHTERQKRLGYHADMFNADTERLILVQGFWIYTPPSTRNKWAHAAVSAV